MQMSILTADLQHIPDHIPAVMAPATRSSSLDSDSLSGSLSDSGFASSSSTPPTIDTAATSDDDEQHKQHEKRDSRSRIRGHQPHPPHRASSTTKPSNPNPNPNPHRNSYVDPACSTSLLRTTLLSFARFGLSTTASSTRSCPTSCSSPSRSRCSSILGTGPPSEPTSLSLHSNSTTEICTILNPSLAQFSPTPSASSSLAVYSSSTSSRTHLPWSPRLRTQPSPLADDRTSAHSHNTTSPFTFWRKRTTPHISPLILPSISRAHVPDYLPDPALPIDKANTPSRSASDSPSTSCPSGFLKIDGSRDGLTFRLPENATRADRANLNLIVGTPRPSYPIGLGADHDPDLVVVDSPVGEDDNGQPNHEKAIQCKASKRPATIPAHLPESSASIPIPSQPRVKIILPPPPVRASTTPLLKRTNPTPTPTPPTLTSVEKSSRLMRERVHCATCNVAGVDFPRCPRCAEAWCSRECRQARMDELPDGRRKHVCKD